MHIIENCLVTARLAQSVEHRTLNPRVVGSSPTSGAFFLVLYTAFAQLFPYHLQDMLIQGLRITPFQYYHSMMQMLMQNEKSYDSLPNFTAADGKYRQVCLVNCWIVFLSVNC